MKRIVKRLLLLIQTLTLILGLQNSSQAVEGSFSFDEPLRFTLLATSSENVSFLVYSKDEEINDASIGIRDIKDPDGQSLPSTFVTASLASTTVTASGTAVTLKPDRTVFNSPGEYRISLLLGGKTAKGTSAKSTATAIFVKPAAVINLDELKDQTIQVFSYFPLVSAKTTFQLHLQEVTGKADIGALTVNGRSIHIKDTKVLVPGSVQVKILGQDGNPTTDVKANGTAAIQVTISGINKSGAFDTTLVLNSPSLGGTKNVPLKLVVSDIWLWPLLAILIGVGGGYYVNHISSKWRPGQLNKFQIIRLRSEVDSYSRLVSSPEKRERIRSFQNRLRTAEDLNTLGSLTVVKTQLDQVENDLNVFREDEAKALAESQKTFKSLKGQVDLYQTQDHLLEQMDKLQLQNIFSQLKEIKRFLEQHQVDQANESIGDTQALLKNLKRDQLNRFLKTLNSRVTTLKTDEQEKQTFRSLNDTINASLTGDNFDQARNSLDVFRTLVEKIEKEEREIKRGEGRLSLEPLPSVPKGDSESQPLSDIEIVTSPEQRTTDKEITFKFTDNQTVAQSGDKINWDFGDGDSLTDQEIGESVSHRFREPGDYEVVLSVARPGSKISVAQRSESITILKGKTEGSLDEIRRNVLASDRALLVIALLLASLTGLLFLYVGKPFGSLTDYLGALLWGFGIDNSVRGFAGVMTKLTGAT